MILFTHRRHVLGIAVNAGFHPLTLARDAKVFLAHLTLYPLSRYCPLAGQLTVASGWGPSLRIMSEVTKNCQKQNKTTAVQPMTLWPRD